MGRFYTVTLFSFDFPLNFLKSLLATHYVARSFLPAWRDRGVKGVLAFPKIFRFDLGSSVKILQQNTNNIFLVVRFDKVMLFSFDFSSNFFKFLLLRIMLHVHFSLLRCAQES